MEGLDQRQALIYRVAALLLDRCNLRRLLQRSDRRILARRLAAEPAGVVAPVMFPTGLDFRPDGTLTVYYGMADSRIGAARACLPELLASELVDAAYCLDADITLAQGRLLEYGAPAMRSS